MALILPANTQQLLKVAEEKLIKMKKNDKIVCIAKDSEGLLEVGKHYIVHEIVKDYRCHGNSNIPTFEPIGIRLSGYRYWFYPYYFMKV